jgi:hypothetical protein
MWITSRSKTNPSPSSKQKARSGKADAIRATCPGNQSDFVLYPSHAQNPFNLKVNLGVRCQKQENTGAISTGQLNKIEIQALSRINRPQQLYGTAKRLVRQGAEK